jgi:hypothetical protein
MFEPVQARGMSIFLLTDFVSGLLGNRLEEQG